MLSNYRYVILILWCLKKKTPKQTLTFPTDKEAKHDWAKRQKITTENLAFGEGPHKNWSKFGSYSWVNIFAVVYTFILLQNNNNIPLLYTCLSPQLSLKPYLTQGLKNTIS